MNFAANVGLPGKDRSRADARAEDGDDAAGGGRGATCRPGCCHAPDEADRLCRSADRGRGGASREPVDGHVSFAATADGQSPPSSTAAGSRFSRGWRRSPRGEDPPDPRPRSACLRCGRAPGRRCRLCRPRPGRRRDQACRSRPAAGRLAEQLSRACDAGDDKPSAARHRHLRQAEGQAAVVTSCTAETGAPGSSPRRAGWAAGCAARRPRAPGSPSPRRARATMSHSRR